MTNETPLSPGRLNRARDSARLLQELGGDYRPIQFLEIEGNVPSELKADELDDLPPGWDLLPVAVFDAERNQVQISAWPTNSN